MNSNENNEQATTAMKGISANKLNSTETSILTEKRRRSSADSDSDSDFEVKHSGKRSKARGSSSDHESETNTYALEQPVPNSDMDSDTVWHTVDSKNKKKKKGPKTPVETPIEKRKASGANDQPKEKKTGGRKLPLFKVSETNGFNGIFAVVTSLEKNLLKGHKISARTSRDGTVIITPYTQETVDLLSTVEESEGKAVTVTLLNPEDKVRKMLLLRYPLAGDLAVIENHPRVSEAKRLMSWRTKTPTGQILVGIKGELSDSLDLGIWGRFPLRSYVPEPIRCFNCQRFGHIKQTCQSRARCGICSGPHLSEVCIKSYKASSTKVMPKCPNCSKGHHAWNTACENWKKEMGKNQASATQKKNFVAAPSGTFVWGQQRVRSNEKTLTLTPDNPKPDIRDQQSFPGVEEKIPPPTKPTKNPGPQNKTKKKKKKKRPVILTDSPSHIPATPKQKTIPYNELVETVNKLVEIKLVETLSSMQSQFFAATETVLGTLELTPEKVKEAVESIKRLMNIPRTEPENQRGVAKRPKPSELQTGENMESVTHAITADADEPPVTGDINNLIDLTGSNEVLPSTFMIRSSSLMDVSPSSTDEEHQSSSI